MRNSHLRVVNIEYNDTWYHLTIQATDEKKQNHVALTMIWWKIKMREVQIKMTHVITWWHIATLAFMWHQKLWKDLKNNDIYVKF